MIIGITGVVLFFGSTIVISLATSAVVWYVLTYLEGKNK